MSFECEIISNVFNNIRQGVVFDQCILWRQMYLTTILDRVYGTILWHPSVYCDLMFSFMSLN